VQAVRPVIVAYDITENKKRYRVLKIIKQWRLGGQKSVHECRLKLNQAEELFLQISEYLDHETDCLLMAWLEPNRPVLCRGIAESNIRNNVWHI
jgi:CRISPR-associated protein Cas2